MLKFPTSHHFYTVHYWVINASTQCRWVQTFTSRIGYLISLLTNMVPLITSVIWYFMTVGSVGGHIPLNWSQFHLLICLYAEKTLVWIAMCGTWVWTWLFWISVNFWCATDVLLHPICDLWAFHKLHFINESSPTAWSMCSGLKDLIESPVVCTTDQAHAYCHTIFC